MSSLLSTLFRTVILDDAAYGEWRERPNLFLRGIVLIVVISLVAGLVSFAVNGVNRVQAVDMADIEDQIYQGFELQSQWNPAWQDPEFRRIFDDTLDVIVPMVRDLTQIKAPLPQGVTGFLTAVGSWLSRALAAIGGWLFYGTLVLVFVNLLGGSAKLPDFLGTVSVYVVPGLLGLLSPIPCVGVLLAFIGTIWSIVVYVKATSVATELDAGRAILAVFAPFFALILLGLLIGALFFVWIAIIF
jgi:hypothetical protein